MQGLVRFRSVMVVLAAAALLAACGHGGSSGTSGGGYSRHDYNPPGPPSDPWGPYIKEAAAKFHVPEQWIRAVMRQESGGHQYLNGQPTTSSAGAAGLLQVMPATYDTLAARYGLGSDPYDPHDNIMAGTAYIRQMYDQFGSPGFLAAYNAGPGRMNAYLAGRGSLPVETVNYMAAISPRLGPAEPDGSSAPVQYASAASEPEFVPIPPTYVEPVADDQPAIVQTAAQVIAPVPAPAAPPPASVPQTETALGDDRTVVVAALPGALAAPPQAAAAPPVVFAPVPSPATAYAPAAQPPAPPRRQWASVVPMPLPPAPPASMPSGRQRQPE